MTKFVASLTDVAAGVDVLVEDFTANVKAMGMEEALDMYMDEATGEFKDEQEIFVVGPLEVANQVAEVLNARYEKEMELMMDAKKMVKEVIETTTTKGAVVEMNNELKIATSEAAQKFLSKHGSKMANAAQAPKHTCTTEGCGNPTSQAGEVCNVCFSNKPNETEGNVKTMGRRRLVTGATQNTNTEKEVVEVKEEKKARRRISTGNTVVESGEKKSAAAGGTRRRLGRQASAVRSEFVKFEGPWYLNTTLYPALERFESIIENMADAELNISDIRLVEPQDIRRYDKEDILVVVQMLSNGTVLHFPIKEAASNSSSDLSASSIGWVEMSKGVRPAFGHWRPNALAIDVTCSCGNKFSANTGNVYCPKCKTRHADAEVSANHNLEFGFKEGWVFEVNPHLVVPRETLALAMAIAQYDAGLNMHGVITEEDAE